MSKTKLLRSMLCLLMGLVCSVGWAQTEYVVSGSTGTFANGSSTTYAAKWTYNTSTDNPAELTLSVYSGKNNMKKATSDDMLLYPGNDKSSIYVLAVPAPYQITGYSFTCADKGETQDKTITIGESVTNLTTEEQTIEQTGLATQSASFVLAGSNQEVRLTNFKVNIQKNDAITYSYKYNNQEIAREIAVVTIGEAFPSFTALPYGFTASVPGGVVAETDVDQTIEIVCTDNLPFVYADDYENITTWYYMQMNPNSPKYIEYIADGNYLEYADTSLPETDTQTYLWAFVGDPVTGFKLYNKSAGKSLAVNSTGSGNPTMAEEGTYFTPAASVVTTEGYFCLKTPSGNYLNPQSGKVNHYSQNDAGSTFILTKYLFTDEAKAKVDTYAANLGEGIGYYSYTVDGTKLYTVEDVYAAIDAATTTEAIEAILNSYAVNLPEAGKMYRFSYDFGNGMLYIQSKNSSEKGLAMTSDVDGKSVFLVENVDGNLRLKSVWTGMYLNEVNNTRGLNQTGGDVTFSAGAALGQIKIQAPSYCHANSSGDNYFVDHCGSDGSHPAHNFYAVEVTEEFFRPIPENGKTYYIYSDTYNDGSPVNRFLYADNSNLKMNTSLQVDESYQWTCTVNDDGTMYFLNGDGKYLGYKTMSDESYAFTVANTNVYNENAVTLYANADSRYIVVANDGSKFDQAQGTFNPQTSQYCTDFVFVEADNVKLLTVEAPSVVKAEATWNGETKTLPATWPIYQGSTISSPTLTISYNAANYTFTGLTEGETSLGESVEIETLDADRTITAGFTPAFFSASTDEEDLVPVRVYSLRDNDYTIRLNTADNYTGHAVNSGTTVYGENEIWYLVGTAESFKMYSRTAGTGLALTLAGTTEGSAATMTAEGTELCLTLTDNGYAISPKTNTGQSFNMYRGKGQDIKLYSVSDDGSVWGIQKVAVDKPLTLKVAINGTQPYATNTRVGHLSFTVDGAQSSTLIKSNVASQVHYLPAGATYSLGSDIVYRGYTFEGLLDAEGNAATYEDATLPDGGISLTATYAVDADNKYQYLAYSPDETYGHPYRIPAITTASNGDVIAAYDYRPCGNDIGSGEVDIMFRRSSDNGATWTNEVCIANGQGGNENVFNVGFGDAAIVADRESGNVLIMSVAGKQFFPDGSATGHNFMACTRSHDNGQSWEDPKDVTSLFMTPQGAAATVETALFPNAYTMFFGSGRLLQSRVYKAEGSSYYRVYGALVIKNADDAHADSYHNFVVYSDDFGETWKILGGSIAAGDACSSADEPKVEELADGSIVLSTRKSYGRWFNVFTFTDKAAGTGSWSTQVESHSVTGGIAIGANACNGEIMKVKAVRNSDGTVCDLMLQSIPTGNSREKVTVYYKEMVYGENDANVYTPTTFAQNWSKGLEVSSIGSAYSTMTLQNDGKIGFFYEEEPSGYCLVYVPLSLSEMTNDAYSLYNDSEEATALIEEAEAALACTGVGYPTETAAARTALTEAVSAVKTNASYEGIATLNAALSAYTTSTEDIQMPQDGDTYVIYNVLQGATSNTAATNNVLRYDEASGVLTVAQKSATDDDAEKFVCRVIDAANNLYAFVNAKNGKFVLYYSPKSTEAAAPYAADNGKATGFASSYNNVSSSDYWLNPVDANDLFLMSQADTRFGTMSISCKADKVSWVVEGWCTMVIDDNEIYMNSGRADGHNDYYPQITYDTGESCLFAFEKVAYPNNVKLNTIKDTDECIINLGVGNGVGTFSAPFATLLPTGVKAWYAVEKSANGALLEVAEGEAIPANQGVILVGEPGISNALMIPAKTNGTETIANIENNLFLHTAGTTHTLEAGDYVLGNRVYIDGEYFTKGAAFYQGTIGTVLSKNKAYIQLGSNSNVKAFGLDFGGRPTGIDAIATDGDTSLPVYDISGRRVSQLQKGGIYIRGGKKFIVK